MPLAVDDDTIHVLRRALDTARLGNDDRLAAVRRLDDQARLLERATHGPSFEALVATEARSRPDPAAGP